MQIIKIDDPTKYAYVFSPYLQPIAKVLPGEKVIVETQDAFGGAISSPEDIPSQNVHLPYVNPQTGPIFVEGAEKGDTIGVEIVDIQPLRGWGASWIAPDFGGLVGTNLTRLLHPPLPEKLYIYSIKDGYVYFNEKIRFPYKPFYGTVATAPELEAISTLTPGPHGGNMDLPETCVGNIVYLPVKVNGGLLYLGDVHAAQGDGEVCGSAVEIPARSTIVVHLRKKEFIEWPRVESESHIMAVGSARPMEDAIRIAFVELIRWLEKDYGMDQMDAYQLCTQVATVRLGNMVDTAYTLAAKFPKSLLLQSIRIGPVDNLANSLS
jgi:amidase